MSVIRGEFGDANIRGLIGTKNVDILKLKSKNDHHKLNESLVKKKRPPPNESNGGLQTN